MNEELQKELAARSVLSQQRFDFDLQRFGGGGGGKSRGKIFASILFGAIGFIWAAPLFHVGCWAGAILGASLGGSIWTATHQKSFNMDMGNVGSPDVQRFDRAQETMSTTAQIPVVYGMRKISGNQTYHWTNAEANELHKHVVLCEGGIEGVTSVTANDLMVPTGNQSEGAVFTIQNRLDKNAHVDITDKHLHLSANGNNHDVYLCNKDDAQKNESFYEWQVNTTSLISYINRMHDGWEAFPTAASAKYPGDLRMDGGNCYNNPLRVMADTVTGGTTYQFHDCEAPDNYTEVGGYPGLAWLDMHFSVNQELNGNPNVSAIVKGRKVYDLRTGKTEYSTNPAMCLLDFLTNKRFGLGKWITMDDIDKDSWIESADYCDEVIEFHNSDNVVVKAKRYELNMVIDQSASGINWIQEILANFAGYLTMSDGKLKLKVEQRTPVSYKFNDSNCSDISIAPLKLSETPNRYSIKIIDPLNNWVSVSCLCEDFADQKQRGKIVTKEVQLNGVTSQSQALRLARFYRDYNLACPLNISFKTGLQAMHLEPGDVVTVSYHGVFDGLPIRISQIKETEDEHFEIEGRQYNPELYNDDLGGGIHWYNYTTDSDDNFAKLEPTQVKNLEAWSQYRLHADGKTGYDIVVSFDLPERYDINEAIVYYRENNARAAEVSNVPSDVALDKMGFYVPWKEAGTTSHRLTIRNVSLGDEYEIKVRTRSDSGMLSDDATAPTIYVLVAERSTVPSQPQNLRYDFSNSFYFEWDDVPDADVLYYEIRTNEQVGNSDGLLGRPPDTSISVSLTSRVGKVYVFAINRHKKASFPAIVAYKYPKPPAPDKLTVSQTPRGVNIVAPPFPSGVHRIVFYLTGASYSQRFELRHPVLQFNGEPDIYDVRAAYIDLLGEGDLSDIFSVVIKPTFNPEWIEDGSISMAKFDSLSKDALKSIQDTAGKFEKIDQNIAELTKTDSSIHSEVADVKTQTASQITELSNKIDFAVTDSRKGLASEVKQNADMVQSIVAELGKDPKTSKYSSITQLADGINARVQKGDVINQINMTSTGTTIDGKYLHVTGKTKFDDNVITDKMIQAGAISADKLAAGSIDASRIRVDELSALTAKIGLLRTKDSGARVEISDNLIKVYDDNNICRVKLGVW